MNKFVKSEYDKFKKKEVVSFKEEIELEISNLHMDIVEAKIDFRKITLEEHEGLVMDIQVVSTCPVNLSNGQLQMIIDDGELISLPAHKNFSNPYLSSYHEESCWYELSDGLLKVLCEASSIDMRITNGDDYADLSTKELQWGARVMYNAVIDENAYRNEIEEKKKEEKKRTNSKSTKMSFAEAIAYCLKNYANFKGKASRSEYWWWVLFNYIYYWIVGAILALLFGSMPIWVAILVNIPLWIPSLAVSVRRCHDTNHSGWCVLIPIYNIVLMLLPSKD